MKKLLTTVLAAGALVAAVQQAQAATFRDVRNGAGLLNPGDSATDTFDIVTASGGITITQPVYVDYLNSYTDIAGFQVGTDIATSANASFYFRDALSDETTEIVQIKLDETALVNDGVVFNGGFAILGGPANDVTILGSINADGQLDYTVTVTGGSSVIFDYANLTVTARRETVGTPDGGATAALLGLGMLGIAALRRKLS